MLICKNVYTKHKNIFFFSFFLSQQRKYIQCTKFYQKEAYKIKHIFSTTNTSLSLSLSLSRRL